MPVSSTWNLPNFREAAQAGLKDAAEHILAESQKLVPLEEATLARSGIADVQGLEASISYDTVYAARQHEELDWQHGNGRQAKYLEQPMNTEANTALKIIGDTITRALS